MQIPPLVTDYSAIPTSPLTDVSFLLVLDYASRVSLLEHMPEPLRSGFAALSARPPGPHVTLAVPHSIPTHDGIESVRRWCVTDGASLMRDVRFPKPVAVRPYDVVRTPGGVRLLVTFDLDLEAIGVTAASTKAAEALAAGSKPPANDGVLESFHISLATIDQAATSEEVTVSTDWIHNVGLSANRVELALATLSPYAGLKARLPSMPIAPGTALS